MFLSSHLVPWCCPFLLFLDLIFPLQFIVWTSILLFSSYSLLLYYFEVTFVLSNSLRFPLPTYPFVSLCSLLFYVVLPFSFDILFLWLLIRKSILYGGHLLLRSIMSPPKLLCPETNPGPAFRQAAALTTYLRVSPLSFISHKLFLDFLFIILYIKHCFICRPSDSTEWMRSNLVVRASDCQCTSCNGPGFDPSIRWHSGIWGASDEAVLNTVRKKKSPEKYLKKKIPLSRRMLGLNPKNTVATLALPVRRSNHSSS